MNSTISYIDWGNFEEDKVEFLTRQIIGTNKDNGNTNNNNDNKFKIMTPFYKYDTQKSNRLYILTPFMKLEKQLHWDMSINMCSIKPTTANLDFGQIVEFIAKYNDVVKNILDSPTDKWSTDMAYNEVKFNLKLKGGKIVGNIVNHNVSKKYPKTEKIDNVADLNLKFKKGKYVRFLLKPVTWFNKENKKYGLFFEIDTMEIKYPHATIMSDFDRYVDVYSQPLGDLLIYI